MKRWLRQCAAVLLTIVSIVRCGYARMSDESVLLDDEIETFITEIVQRIAGALGFKQEILVYVLASQSLNAAATEHGFIVINAGAILQCDDVRELIAIIAHEVGHIDGHHITTLRAHITEANTAGLVPMLVGAAVAAISGNPAPLLAGVLGGQSVAIKMTLSKMRQKEGMADTRAAQAMEKLCWPIFQSYVTLHEKLSRGGGPYDVYLSTHPTSEDRVAKYRKLLVEQGKWNVPQKTYALLNRYQTIFERVKAKVAALIHPTENVLATTAGQRNANERYARAIALYRTCKYKESRAMLDGLLAEAVTNDVDPAYYTEIKAMCLIRQRQCKAVAETCWDILRHDGGTRIHRDLGLIYADSVIEGTLRDHARNAINILKKIKLHRRDLVYINGTLGKIYALLGQHDEASLCAAEVALGDYDYRIAKLHAGKALSSKRTAIRARDIASEVDRLEKQAAQ